MNFGQNFELEITLNYFFKLELSSIKILNYSETYFELDSEEATHCHHCHLISCVYIIGLVNTKDQSNTCMCENGVEGYYGYFLFLSTPST